MTWNILRTYDLKLKFELEQIQKKIERQSISRTTNKAFKRGSSFCSSSQPYLQNEDPHDD